MRAAGIRRFGDRVETLDLPDVRAPRDDEVLIDVAAAGVANWDDIVRTGDWDVGLTPPMALGVEAAGTVAAVGAGVDDWVVGDDVLTHPLPLRDQGAWAPRLLAPAALLARKPASVSWHAAAAFPVPALTAQQAVADALGAASGEALLVNGAGGVTGGLLVSVAAMLGATVFATASPSNHARLRRLGAQHPIDYHDAHWHEQVLEATGGRGVASAVNAVPGGAVEAMRAVRDGGRLATITTDPPEETRGIRISSVIVRPDGSQLQALSELLGTGRLQIEIGSVFHIDEAAEALAAALRGGGGGAVVLELLP
jgi:NADPH:quinone reductase-like Zn-dependent oxidoreductase